MACRQKIEFPVPTAGTTGTSGVLTLQFTATGTQTTLQYQVFGTAGLKTGTLDNLNVCRLPDAYALFQPTSVSVSTGYNGSNLTFSTGSSGQGIKLVLPTVPGEVYDVSFDYTKITSTISAATVWAGGTQVQSLSASGPVSFTFTATGTQTELKVLLSGTTGTKTATLDNFVVKHDVQYSLPGGGYRFGFNGQEKDDEVYGEGNAYAFEYRIHDPRIGRFLSIDPLTSKYPSLTPYQFAGDNPIFNIDNDGRDITPFIYRDDAGNITMIEFVITGKIVFQDGINRSDERKEAIGKKINAGIEETWIIENGAGNSIPPEWRNADGSAIKFK